ncbi:MAG: carbohydrate-binding domain-containing protein [bacterium]|nr:carbohydrate-binding domain-containing protein [bacterium]
MRKFVLNTAILTVSVLLVFAIVQNYISFRDREMAESHRNKYLWNKAGKFFRKAIKTNPSDSSRYSDYADFLLYQSDFSKDAEKLLFSAGELYAKASSLNPCWQEYPLKIAGIKVKLADITDKRASETIGGLSKEVMGFFRNAYENDPAGFNTSYIIGYYGMRIYDELDDKDKKFITGRMRYCLNEKPWYSIYVYPVVWDLAKNYSVLREITPTVLSANELLFLFMTQKAELIRQWEEQYNKIQELRRTFDAESLNVKIARIKELKENLFSGLDKPDTKKIDGESWLGVSECGDQDITHGNMFFNGIVFGAAEFPFGRTELIICARGEKSDDMWPYMVVLLNDEIIGETFVETSDWSEYSFSVNSDGGPKIISIMFINDGGNEKEDRNLYIGDAWVESIE